MDSSKTTTDNVGQYWTPLSLVKGECPMGCGQTLFLGSGGYVTCSNLRCPQPDCASRMLETSTSIRKVFEKYGIGSS